MRRYSLLFLMLAVPALLAAACGESVVDNDTATVTPRSPRDSVRLRDSIVYDTVDVPIARNGLRDGWVYFRAPVPGRGLDSIPMTIDSFSYAEVSSDNGLPVLVQLRVMARVVESPPSLALQGIPSWVYLYADTIVLGVDGRGEEPLSGDPRNNQTGLALFLRPPFSGDLFVTIGTGHGRVVIDSVDQAQRVVHANLKANFGGPKPFAIDSIAMHIGY